MRVMCLQAKKLKNIHFTKGASFIANRWDECAPKVEAIEKFAE
jgi:hypothetical protein